MTNHYLYDLLRKVGLSDFGARTGEFIVDRPLRIAAILVVAAVAARIGGRSVERFVHTVHARSPLRPSSPRADLRTRTMAGVLARLVRFVVALVAGLLVLGVLGLNLAPLLAGAGIAGVAIGFGAQSLVRDMLAGLFIIGEDQYGIGDTVDLGAASGVVEDVNLRTTRVRGADGSVWFVPNGQITRVANASMEYARAVIDVPVPVGVSARRVESVVREEAGTLAADDAWRDRVLGPPEVLGMQALDKDGATLRVTVKTVPAGQQPLARALRQRVVERLFDEGINPPAPAAAAT